MIRNKFFIFNRDSIILLFIISLHLLKHIPIIVIPFIYIINEIFKQLIYFIQHDLTISVLKLTYNHIKNYIS